MPWQLESRAQLGKAKADQAALRQEQESFPTVTKALAILYATLAIFHFTFLSGELQTRMLTLALGTSLVMLAISFVAVRSKDANFTSILGGAAILLVALNSVLHLAWSGQAFQTTNVSILLIGAGALLLSRTPFWAATTGTIVLWTGTFWYLSLSNFDHYAFAIGLSWFVGIIVRRVRLNSVYNQEILRQEEVKARRKAETWLATIQREEARYRSLAEHSSDLILLMDEQSTIHFSSSASQTILGRNSDDFAGKSLRDIVSPGFTEDFERSVATAIQNRSSAGTWRLQHAGNWPVWVEARINKLPDGLLHAVVRDVESRTRLENIKDQVIRTVSHELRTPLTSIHGALKLMGSPNIQPDQREQMLGVASQGAERLIHMVNDMLDLERLRAGSQNLRITEFGGHALIDDVATSLGPLTLEKRVAIETTKDEVQVKADIKAVRQVLTNLTGNALRYSPPETTITIGCKLVDTDVQFWVEDQGPGIPITDRMRVFEPFEQVDKGGMDTAGTGLGLTICKDLVSAHGGKIWVEGEAGARFVFSIPPQQVTPKMDRSDDGNLKVDLPGMKE